MAQKKSREVILMKGRGHSPRAGGAEAARGRQAARGRCGVADVCRHLEVSIQTYQRWRSQFKAMRPQDVANRLTQSSRPSRRNSRSQAPPVQPARSASKPARRVYAQTCALRPDDPRPVIGVERPFSPVPAVCERWILEPAARW